MTKTRDDDRAPKSPIVERDDLALAGDDFAIRQAAVSSALAGVFRGKFCDAILPAPVVWGNVERSSRVHKYPAQRSTTLAAKRRRSSRGSSRAFMLC